MLFAVVFNSLQLLTQVNSLPADKLQEIQKAIELFSVGQGPAKTMEEASRRSYQFWDTQPVPKLGMMHVMAVSCSSLQLRMPCTADMCFLTCAFVC